MGKILVLAQASQESCNCVIDLISQGYEVVAIPGSSELEVIGAKSISSVNALSAGDIKRAASRLEVSHIICIETDPKIPERLNVFLAQSKIRVCTNPQDFFATAQDG